MYVDPEPSLPFPGIIAGISIIIIGIVVIIILWKNTKNAKTRVHSISLLFPAVLFSVGSLASGYNNFITGFVMSLIIVVFLTGINAFFYYLAGGFDWQPEKLSVIRGILFFVLSGLFYGLILYGTWYLVRLTVAKSFNLPLADLKGKLLTR